MARAMLRVQEKARKGDLIPEAEWLKRTRLIFLKKKGSKTPRPVRMGEFLRGSMTKKDTEAGGTAAEEEVPGTSSMGCRDARGM